MKLKNLKKQRKWRNSVGLITLLVSTISTCAIASNCDKHPRPGCPDDVTIQFFEEVSANIAAATFAASVDLLPSEGKWRLDGALANVDGENGAGATLMHRFNGDHNWAVGASAGISDGYEAYRVNLGVEF